MSWLAPLAGVIVLLTLLWDVYPTVFVPRGPAGPVSRRLYASAWDGWRRIADQLPAESRRHRLSLLGPLLVPLIVLTWACILIVGYALIYYPWAGAFIASPSELEEFPAWAKALYYSGYSATTLGVGDVVPRGMALRFVSVLEAAHGFMLFSVAITYLLSIYSALNRSTALALEISRFLGRDEGQEPADLLIAMASSGAERDVVEWMARTSSSLASVVQWEGQYPLLHYFHIPDDDRALLVALTDLLEVVTLARSLLCPNHFPALSEGPVTTSLERLARRHLTAGAGRFGRDDRGTGGLERERRRRYAEARRRLEAAGVPLREDGQAWRAYERLRPGWDVADEGVRTHFGYSEIRRRGPAR